MHPTELIELMMVGGVVTVIVIISLFLKGKRRKIGWLLALGFLLAYCVLFFARPYGIDAKIDRKVELLEPYLEERYPNTNWTITTVPHRTEGYKHLNPYYIGVIFEDEPEVTYHYWVERKEIYQISLSYRKENKEEFKYQESE